MHPRKCKNVNQNSSFSPNPTQPAECGEASLPGVPGLVPRGGVLGLEVQRASQGGQCGQWQAHSHPMWEPRFCIA